MPWRILKIALLSMKLAIAHMIQYGYTDSMGEAARVGSRRFVFSWRCRPRPSNAPLLRVFWPLFGSIYGLVFDSRMT